MVNREGHQESGGARKPSHTAKSARNAPMQFLDQTGPLWTQGQLVDKTVSSFASTATPHGGQETTIVALNNTFYHWGSILVPPGYADPIQFKAGNPYGTSFVSDNAERKPDEIALAAARFQGRRVAEVTMQFLAGRPVGAGAETRRM